MILSLSCARTTAVLPCRLVGVSLRLRVWPMLSYPPRLGPGEMQITSIWPLIPWALYLLVSFRYRSPQLAHSLRTAFERAVAS